MPSAARIVALAFLAALAGCETLSNPAQQSPDPGNRTAAIEAVPGQYIVVLRDNVADPATLANELVTAAGGSLLRVYTSAIKGFAAQLSAPAAAALEGNPLVARSEEHTSELQSRLHLVCRLLLEKKKKKQVSATRH